VGLIAKIIVKSKVPVPIWNDERRIFSVNKVLLSGDGAIRFG
jgi:hypothetical protein